MNHSLLFAAITLSATTAFSADTGKRLVVAWSEGTVSPKIYPNDINGAVAEGLACLDGWEVVKASINDPDQGLSDERLNRCDVLIWWGHKKHGMVKDELAQKIAQRVRDGKMGFIGLHSTHFAKPNKLLMGTPCSWGGYKLDTTTLTITVKDPNHPIAKGIKDFTIEHEERYIDPYAVPTPQSVVFEGDAKLKNGTMDHSQVGFCWEIGKGRVFYLQAGHESKPVYCDANIRKIIANAVLWTAPAK